MPIYEYRCADCGHELEAMQKLSEAPLTDCPACQAGRLRKRISPVAFRLKGSGWYETDFKSGQQKNVAAADNGGQEGEGGAKEQADGDAAQPAADGKGDQAKDGKKAAGDGDAGKGAAADAPKPAPKPSKESSKSE